MNRRQDEESGTDIKEYYKSPTGRHHWMDGRLMTADELAERGLVNDPAPPPGNYQPPRNQAAPAKRPSRARDREPEPAPELFEDDSWEGGSLDEYVDHAKALIQQLGLCVQAIESQQEQRRSLLERLLGPPRPARNDPSRRQGGQGQVRKSDDKRLKKNRQSQDEEEGTEE